MLKENLNFLDTTVVRELFDEEVANVAGGTFKSFLLGAVAGIGATVFVGKKILEEKGTTIKISVESQPAVDTSGTQF